MTRGAGKGAVPWTGKPRTLQALDAVFKRRRCAREAARGAEPGVVWPAICKCRLGWLSVRVTPGGAAACGTGANVAWTQNPEGFRLHASALGKPLPAPLDQTGASRLGMTKLPLGATTPSARLKSLAATCASAHRRGTLGAVVLCGALLCGSLA